MPVFVGPTPKNPKKNETKDYVIFFFFFFNSGNILKIYPRLQSSNCLQNLTEQSEYDTGQRKMIKSCVQCRMEIPVFKLDHLLNRYDIVEKGLAKSDVLKRGVVSTGMACYQLGYPTALHPYCSCTLGLLYMLKLLLSSSLMEVVKPGCPGNVESGETSLS